MAHKIWNVISKYFDTHNVAANQVDSFNDFINNRIQHVVDEESTITIQNPDAKTTYTVVFGQIMVGNPSVVEEDRRLRLITPHEARVRDITYCGPIYINLTEKLTSENGTVVFNKQHNMINIGKMPIMLYSSLCNLHSFDPEKHGECPNDPGGYFVIKGKERVLVAQERQAYDQIGVFFSNAKSAAKNGWYTEVRSMSDESGHSVVISAKIGPTNNNITLNLPHVGQPIPAAIVFKALGYTKPQTIIDIINPFNEKVKSIVKNMIRETYEIDTQQKAIQFIKSYLSFVPDSEKQLPCVIQLFKHELLPHLGINATDDQKIFYIGKMIHKLVLASLGIISETDKDDIENKREDDTCVLVYDLYRSAYKKFFRNIHQHLEKKNDILYILSKPNINSLSKDLNYAFSTGNWGVQKGAYMKKGVSQILSRLSPSATISHLRRININSGKEVKNVKIRQLHSSQYGFVCNVESPEGQAAGIVKNITLFARISIRIPSSEVLAIIEECDQFREFEFNVENTYTIIINKCVVGITDKPDELVKQLRKLRRQSVINRDVGITIDTVTKEINLYCDCGRMMRPLFTIEDNKLLFEANVSDDWETLVYEGCIEYLDCYEYSCYEIAMYPWELKQYPYQYCEIDPTFMFGVCASLVPFPDHSPAPRNVYQCAMGKQAIGMFNLAYVQRVDTVSHVLWYPQKPLVSTKYNDFLKMDKMVAGINAIVAIAPFNGFNQEDSVILNRSAIEKGLFLSTCFKTVICEEKKISVQKLEYICVPELQHRSRSFNYNKLDSNGIVKPGFYVKPNDVIIGKITVTTKKDTSVSTTKDCSVIVKNGEEGVVDKIIITLSSTGNKLIKVCIRTLMYPEIGDKVASRSAQKGTCGMVYSQEDLPFSLQGIVPDVIINPHCIPSRMTISHLLECLVGKKCVLEGTFGDATPFGPNSTDIVDKISGELKDLGFSGTGNETMMNGFTGEMFKAKIFFGPTYYQKLKHIVKEKIHARDYGNVQALTRQPLEGRSRDGGLRFGEMERDAIISHGASQLLKERLFDMSDPYQMYICKTCGIIAHTTSLCTSCKDDVILVKFPYASKLLFQELNTMCLKTKMICNE